MAYPASKKIGYLGQFGIFAGFTAGGILLGVIATFIMLAGKVDVSSLAGASAENAMDALFVPENANYLRVLQFVTTFLMFFIPAVVYAAVCHKKPFTHLGFKNSVNLKQLVMTILVMLAALPFVGWLSEITEQLPLSEATLERFKRMEDEYMKQIEVIGRMDSTADFIISLFMLAVLPAIFEETIFRGGLQNLLSRWWKSPLVAIIITSIIFSVVHLSFIGFLSRFVLGFLLGWMYHRTGNLWLSIIGHVANNAFALTTLYIMKLRNPNMSLDDSPEVSIWLGLTSVIVLLSLLFVLDRVSKHQIDRPGQEVPISKEENDPFMESIRQYK